MKLQERESYILKAIEASKKIVAVSERDEFDFKSSHDLESNSSGKIGEKIFPLAP